MSIKNSTQGNNKYSMGAVLDRGEKLLEAPFRGVGAVVGKAPRLIAEGAAVGGGFLVADWGVDHLGKLNSGEISFGQNAMVDPIISHAVGYGAIGGGGLLIAAGVASGVNTAYQAVKEEFAANQG